MSAFGGKSGHGLDIAECLLLTQNGHQPVQTIGGSIVPP